MRVQVLMDTGGIDGGQFITMLPPAAGSAFEVFNVEVLNAKAVTRGPKLPGDRAAERPESVVDNDFEYFNLSDPKDDPAMTLSAYRPILEAYPSSGPDRSDEQHQTFGRFLNRAKTLFRKNTAKYDAEPASAATTTSPDPVSDAPHDEVPADFPPPLFEPTAESFVEERAMKKAIAIVAKGPGYLRRGAQAMQQVFVTTTKMHDAIVSDLRVLHPPSSERPPVMPVVPDIKVSSVSEVDLLAALRAMATGAAAGPNGITVELLLLLASDDVCRKALCLMVRDIINNDIPGEIRKRLTRCRLVALAKDDGGTRPIAIGDALLKVAGKILFMRHKEEINKYFGDLQFGCLSSGGCETVAHNVRADVEQGRCVLTIDQKNAFNSPSRKAIGEALHGISEFRSFWPIFALEYGIPSELLYFANKRHHTTLMSETGTRQGSSLGGFYFCLVMQPILRAMQDRFPDIRIYASTA